MVKPMETKNTVKYENVAMFLADWDNVEKEICSFLDMIEDDSDRNSCSRSLANISSKIRAFGKSPLRSWNTNTEGVI